MNKSTLTLLVGAALITTTLSGCIVVNKDDYHAEWESRQEVNRERIANLAIGDSYDITRDSMGVPQFTETFTESEDVYRVLFYRTHREHSDGETTKDECTPLVFKNGILVGWGQKAYRQI